MPSPSTAVLVRMLEPWLVRARMRLAVTSTDPFAQPGKQPLWIDWIVPEGGDLTVEDVEAMELLELLARVDFRASWKTILEITKQTLYLDQVVDAAPAVGDPEAVYARYDIVGLQDALTNSSLKPTLRLLLLEIDPEDHSPMYYAVRQTLLQSYADRHQQGRVAPFARSVNQRIPLKFSIEFSGIEEGLAQRLMDEVATAALLTEHPDWLELYPSWQQLRERKIPALSGVFKLHAIGVDFDSDTATDAMVLSAKSIWEDTNVMVSWIEFDPRAGRLSPAVATECFRSILGIGTQVTAPSMLILCAGGTMVEFGAACSALATNQGLPYVCFSVSGGDVRLFWAWIAYAMFSCDAAHKISKLRIDTTGLTQECVDVFESVCKAQDPLAVVWKCHNGEFGQAPNDQAASRVRAVADVNPRATLLLVNERGKLRSGNDVETLRIVDDSTKNQHVCVLYPGAGMCWVHRSQIIRRREIEPSTPSESTITYLCVDIHSSTKINALTQLLLGIGFCQLENFEVVGNSVIPVDEASFVRLLQMFPCLRRLDLASVEVANFDWLKVCGSKLRALSLRDVKTRRQDSYKRLLSSLASPDASALVELHLQQPATKLEGMMASIERMLQRNRLMERTVLSVGNDETEIELNNTLAERIEKQSGGLLAAQRAPLPLKSKLAFIFCSSLVCSSSSRDHKQPLVKMEQGESRAQLDAEVIAMIFRFAAPCKRRLCGFIHSITGSYLNDCD